MKSTIALLAAGLAVPALAAPSYEYLDIVPLAARQNVSPEKYDCHSNCGNAILDGASGTDHCSSSEWKTLFDECMECALEFDIWQHYGDGVTKAATACNLAINLKSNETTTESETTSATTEEKKEEEGAASQMTSSGSMMLFAMIAAAGLL